MNDVSVFQAGSIPTWADHAVTVPDAGFTRRGMRFLGDALGLCGGEVSLNVFAPGQAMPFSHRHRANEEVYLFLSGTGEMLLDGAVVPLAEGTCVRCSPAAARAWRNTGTTPMAFVVVQYPQRDDVPRGTADGQLADDLWPA